MRTPVTYEHLIVYALVYFFLNSFLLPHGLLYTTLLTPVMLYYLYREGKMTTFLHWSLLLLIPIPFQISTVVDFRSYVVSSLLIIAVSILYYTSYLLIKDNEREIRRVFRTIMIVNGLLMLTALLVLPIAPLRNGLWYTEIITRGLGQIPRLKLFTYEASYYAFIMSPVFIYYLLRILNGVQKHPMIMAIVVGASLMLSLSFGVLGALAIAILAGVIIFRNQANQSLRRFTMLGGISVLATIVLMMILWPHNPVFFRIGNIIEGTDTSAMGRLYYSFMFAKDLMLTYNPFFGIGPGQVKVVAHDMIVNHYQYSGELADIVRIPNSMAEMLATYGIYGFLVKLLLEMYFFFRWRLYNNMYSLVLFTFMWVYQFTGSFINNAAEVVGWAIVYGLRFPEMEKKTKPDES